EDAYALTKAWLQSHPNDVSELANFAECQVTTGRFADAVRIIDVLLKPGETDMQVQVALLELRITALVGQGQGREALSQLGHITQVITEQPEHFRVTWNFEGASHFVGNSAVFAEFRAPLLTLFEALGEKDRAAILARIAQLDA